MLYYATSDPEGYDILKMTDFNPNKSDNKLIICGDILDSTFIGNISSDYDKLKAKSFNLRNIRNVLLNKNITLVLGNRDLNKIKCMQLCKLSTKKGAPNNELINKFNNGNIDLNKETYEIIFKFIKGNKGPSNDETPASPWKIYNMSKWYTFWAEGLGKGKEWNKTMKEYYIDDKGPRPQNYPQPFLTRFKEIFGKDNVDGTMSADNLLYTIPHELGLSSLNLDRFKQVDYLDYFAFIVLAVFNSMLINDGTKPIDNPFVGPVIPNSSSFKGWLYQLYKSDNTNPIYYLDGIKSSENNKMNLIIFSHGGVTKDLISNPNILDSFINLSNSNKPLADILKDSNIFYKNIKKQEGGYYDDNLEIINVNSFNLKNNLDIINNKFKDILEKIILEEKENIPTDNMLFMLLMTAPFNCENFVKKLNLNNETLQTLQTCNLNTSIYSPILPGIASLRNNMFRSNTVNVYQIIGHSPIGFSNTIDYYEQVSDTVNKTYSVLINLDTSNTFLGTNENKDLNSKSFVVINTDNNEITTYTNLMLNKNYIEYDMHNITSPQATENLKSTNTIISKEVPKNNIINFVNPINNELFNIIKMSKGVINDKIISIHGYFITGQSGGRSKKHNDNALLYMIYNNQLNLKKKLKKIYNQLNQLSNEELSEIIESFNNSTPRPASLPGPAASKLSLLPELSKPSSLPELSRPASLPGPASGFSLRPGSSLGPGIVPEIVPGVSSGVVSMPSLPELPSTEVSGLSFPTPNITPGSRPSTRPEPKSGISLPNPASTPQTFIVFTLMDVNNRFDKTLYVLSLADFNDFVNISPVAPLMGGDDSYYNKYLKYKSKYMSLKNHLNK